MVINSPPTPLEVAVSHQHRLVVHCSFIRRCIYWLYSELERCGSIGRYWLHELFFKCIQTAVVILNQKRVKLADVGTMAVPQNWCLYPSKPHDGSIDIAQVRLKWGAQYCSSKLYSTYWLILVLLWSAIKCWSFLFSCQNCVFICCLLSAGSKGAALRPCEWVHTNGRDWLVRLFIIWTTAQKVSTCLYFLHFVIFWNTMFDAWAVSWAYLLPRISKMCKLSFQNITGPQVTNLAYTFLIC